MRVSAFLFLVSGAVCYKELIARLTDKPFAFGAAGLVSGVAPMSSRTADKLKLIAMRVERGNRLGLMGVTANEARRMFEQKLEMSKESVCVGLKNLDVTAADGRPTGRVTAADFRSLLQRYNMGMADAEWAKFVKSYDPQSTGFVNYKRLFVLNRREEFTHVPERVWTAPTFRHLQQPKFLPSVAQQAQTLLVSSPIKSGQNMRTKYVSEPKCFGLNSSI
jgi:hypothetical protein